MNFILFVGTALVLMAQYRLSTALDISNAVESSCFDVPKTMSVDMDWFMSKTIWYYPLMSRSDLYFTAVEITKKSPAELREHELYYDSCVTWDQQGSSFGASGFHGKKTLYKFVPVKGFFEVFEGYLENGDYVSTCSTTLTDNSTFIFGVCCTVSLDKEGHMTWGTLTTEKELPPQTEKLIYDHAASLGFKEEYFTRTRYDSCKKTKVSDEL